MSISCESKLNRLARTVYAHAESTIDCSKPICLWASDWQHGGDCQVHSPIGRSNISPAL